MVHKRFLPAAMGNMGKACFIATIAYLVGLGDEKIKQLTEDCMHYKKAISKMR